MFPCNNENPFPYHSTEPLLNKSFPYDHHQNPSSIHHQDDQEPPFLLHFPSPFLDHHDSPLSQVFSQPQHGTSDAAGDHQGGRGKTKKGGASRKTVPRARTGKKDRHSKICTARGVRDRRMRLSLQIARKFFDLQDMLGFDKASKTIEWLFSKSKKAIKELMRTKNMNTDLSSSDDECEVGSIMEENSNNNETITAMKESRQKARAKARERTKEKKKMMIKGLENSSHFYESNPSSLEQLGSSSNSPFLEESCCQEIRSNNASLGFENQFASSVGIMEKYLGGSTSGASMLEYHQDNVESFMGFLGNWDLSGGGGGDAVISPFTDGLAPIAGINPSTLYFGASSFQFLQPLDQEKQFSCNQYSLG